MSLQVKVIFDHVICSSTTALYLYYVTSTGRKFSFLYAYFVTMILAVFYPSVKKIRSSKWDSLLMQSNFYEQRLTSLNKGVPNEEEKERACFRTTF